jgi:hypothetical protein
MAKGKELAGAVAGAVGGGLMGAKMGVGAAMMLAPVPVVGPLLAGLALIAGPAAQTPPIDPLHQWFAKPTGV